MDSGDADPTNRGLGDSKEEEERVGKGEKDDDADETSSLLLSATNGGLAEKPRKSLGRKVTWNDLKGQKLVEVIEFHPSDSSDSEDEREDCMCAIM